ncbi:MAG: hypothetical protein MJ093_03065 [Saccharofermentans sp.]|nr:hypothetical protein [Saccharofermentans sp.]
MKNFEKVIYCAVNESYKNTPSSIGDFERDAIVGFASSKGIANPESYVNERFMSCVSSGGKSDYDLKMWAIYGVILGVAGIIGAVTFTLLTSAWFLGVCFTFAACLTLGSFWSILSRSGNMRYIANVWRTAIQKPGEKDLSEILKSMEIYISTH